MIRLARAGIELVDADHFGGGSGVAEMAERECECKSDRLRRHVEGRLDESEQDVLADHLEWCDQCRGALDGLAGDDRLWTDLLVFLGGETDLSTPRPGPAGQATDERRGQSARDDWDARQAVLAFLDPTEDPRHMGCLGPYPIIEIDRPRGDGRCLEGLRPSARPRRRDQGPRPELSYLGSARLRFAREARAAASVAHEHVVAIHAVDSWKGLPYLVMQYVPGTSLQGRIESDGPLAVEAILRIGMQVASGLAAAHAKGSSIATSNQRISSWKTASSGSRSPTSAWRERPTTRASARAE